MDVVTIETPALGDRSYLVHDGEAALVIDPQRDIDRMMEAAEAAGVRYTHVAETHIHNDYVSGGLDLARRTGAAYVIPDGNDVAFEHRAVHNGDVIRVGRLQVRVMATPGHTRHHAAYLVSEPGQPAALFSGGSLLYGTVGRTDLLGPEATQELTRAQYRSVRRLAAELEDDVAVWPTHGFGSFCSSAPSSGAATATMGRERATNMALTIPDEETFVARLLDGLTAYPRYYTHMAPMNQAGPAPFALQAPEPLDGEGLRRRIREGGWVVDLAERRLFSGGHVPGTISVELGDSFATYLGWVVPWGRPITLVGDSMSQVNKAQRALARIGIDDLDGAATGPRLALAAGTSLAHYPAADFPELARASQTVSRTGVPAPMVLDVRRDDERARGWIEGSLHVPLQDLPDSIAGLPADTLWVHCASGFRASIAASILDRAGHPVVLVDDHWAHAARSGLAIAGPGKGSPK
ncbi:MAG TPA: MBL fold metallo-hydrolase [Actinomycetota bacterium]|nr:MBL fold metallo-hydrolase [Actinomycetota bacterium]